MPSTSVWFGRLLIILGLVGYGYGLYNGNASPTALIPAVFGVILMILGHIAQSKENLRKHLMHGAVIVGLLGFILPLGRIFSNISNFSLTFASTMLISMSVICLLFVILCVKSFIEARKNRIA
jgi:hypothetical protein